MRELEREQQLLARETAAGLPPLLAAGPRILLDFIESYWVVAETLRTLRGEAAPLARSVVLRRCHELGRQLLLQDRVRSPELLSNMNFGNALKLLENLGAAERDGDRWRAGPRRSARRARAAPRAPDRTRAPLSGRPSRATAQRSTRSKNAKMRARFAS